MESTIERCHKALNVVGGGQERCIAPTLANNQFCWEHQPQPDGKQQSSGWTPEQAKDAWVCCGIRIVDDRIVPDSDMDFPTMEAWRDQLNQALVTRHAADVREPPGEEHMVTKMTQEQRAKAKVNDQFVSDLIELVAKHWPDSKSESEAAVAHNQLDIIASLQAPLDVVVQGVYGTAGGQLVTEMFDGLDELDAYVGCSFGMVTDDDEAPVTEQTTVSA